MPKKTKKDESKAKVKEEEVGNTKIEKVEEDTNEVIEKPKIIKKPRPPQTEKQKEAFNKMLAKNQERYAQKKKDKEEGIAPP